MNQKTNKEVFRKEREAYLRMSEDIFVFIDKCFGLVPQQAKPKYQGRWKLILELEGEDWETAKEMVKPEWFGDFDEDTLKWEWYNFKKGVHVSWQQTLVLASVNKAVNGGSKNRLSIASGHGVGKTSVISLVVLWFLFGRPGSQVAATAPSAQQMYDVMWKELSIWISKIKSDSVKSKFQWNKDYIRMIDTDNSEREWFARAKTASKENPEALAGIHANDVMMLADEASGVEDPIFNTMEGALTSGNNLVILISNPTRTSGYFYNTHNKHKEKWQRFQFSSIDSPLVADDYEQEQADLHGRGSEQYGIRVLGQFPSEDNMDDKGFLPLIAERHLSSLPLDNLVFRRNSILGVDPAGEGDDKTVIYIRDEQKARMLWEESISNEKTITEKIMTYVQEYNLDWRNVVVDDFGSVGAKVAREIAIATAGKGRITSVNVGDQCDYDDEKDMFENKRAYMFWKLREWAIGGGLIDDTSHNELQTIRYKRNIRGKIQIMSKLLMKKIYSYASPNKADALALTFLRDIKSFNDEEIRKAIKEKDELDFDPFEPV